MTGLFGVFGAKDAEAGQATARLMADAMVSEGTQVSEVYENSQLGLYLGWVHSDDSARARIPVWNRTRDVLLIFRGEDFGDGREDEGPRCGIRDPEDVSHLLRQYEEVGERFVENINGWFSGVLLDLRQRKTFLFNDRYGLGRIYLCQSHNGLCFASEAKALLNAFPDLRRIDHVSLAEFFSMGCVLQNRTLFTGIELLPPAASWSISPGAVVDKRAYFDPSQWMGLPSVSNAEYYERLKDIIARIVPRYCKGSRKVAMSLTGGLDSRIIMAWARAEPGSLPCYTFGGPYRDCSDLRIARRVARIAGQPHKTISVGSEFLGEFPELARKAVYLSDGTMDVSGAVELYANRIARQIAPVRLTGNYGSEIIRRNIAFRPFTFPRHVLAPEFADLTDEASRTYARERAQSVVSFVAFKQVPWHHFGRLAVERSQITPRSPYLDNALVSLMHQASPEVAADASLLFRLVADGDPRLAKLATERGVTHRPIPVVTRLDQLRREFVTKAEYAYDSGMPQWLAKVDRLLAVFKPERLFLGRNKFYHFRVWYRDDLSEHIKELLLDPQSRSRPYLQGRSLEDMIAAHTTGRANYTDEIHTILTVELVHRTLIDQVGL